jgi:Flp pilus assembly protein TadD
MANKWSFKIRQKSPMKSQPTPFKEAETRLLAKLDDPNENKQAVRRELILFYRTADRTTDAMNYAHDYLAHTTNSEDRMEVYFFIGQTMEHARDFVSASRFYLLSLELKPLTPFYAYFVRNNLGYSLNQLGRYSEAEPLLREAIPIEPERANAFKNLGLSLEGQGKFADAALSYIAAVRVDARDPRALRHLEELVERHPEISAEIPDLSYQINMCRQAVKFAANRRMN